MYVIAILVIVFFLVVTICFLFYLYRRAEKEKLAREATYRQIHDLPEFKKRTQITRVESGIKTLPGTGPPLRPRSNEPLPHEEKTIKDYRIIETLKGIHAAQNEAEKEHRRSKRERYIRQQHIIPKSKTKIKKKR